MVTLSAGIKSNSCLHGIHMLNLYKIWIRTMSSRNKSEKPTLSSKLANQNKVVKPKAIISHNNQRLWDIEDLPDGAAASVPRYFSPVQTRKQRQVNAEPKTDLPAKKARQANQQKVSKIAKITVGSATIIKCKVVPEAKPDKEVLVDISTVKTEVPDSKHDKKVLVDIGTVKTEVLESQPNQEVLVDLSTVKTELPECKPDNEVVVDIGPVKTEEDIPNANWLQQLENIRLMRSEKPAPVDALGCHQCADINADEKTQRFQKLVALMLSSQTKDEATFAAVGRLKRHTLTPVSLQEMPIGVLEGLLHPVSFYKNKAKYLKQTVQILIEKYNADIPDNIPELLKLPGVGPKMAHICMATAWNKITGIGVDTHVHRISNRLVWLKKPTKEPEQTRVQLEKWLPRDRWAEVNHLFVGFGQTICTPLRPKCAECLNRHICPASTFTNKM